MDFQFKEFSINQDRTAMKVGTDGVLLGAWTTIKHNPCSILDIGTGTGLISLQLAQRSNAEIIDALEIDANAFEQAVDNFEKSNWSDRLYCYHASLAEFVEEIDDKYDLIVSNPPFYTEEYHTKSKSRNTARFTNALSFDELIESAAKLLSKNGVFSVIIPFKEKEVFLKLAKKHQLFSNSICDVKGNINSDFKRSLLSFSFNQESVTINNTLIIEIKRHQYTKEYIKLVEDFYLKM